MKLDECPETLTFTTELRLLSAAPCLIEPLPSSNDGPKAGVSLRYELQLAKRQIEFTVLNAPDNGEPADTTPLVAEAHIPQDMIEDMSVDDASGLVLLAIERDLEEAVYDFAKLLKAKAPADDPAHLRGPLYVVIDKPGQHQVFLEIEDADGKGVEIPAVQRDDGHLYLGPLFVPQAPVAGAPWVNGWQFGLVNNSADSQLTMNCAEVAVALVLNPDELRKLAAKATQQADLIEKIQKQLKCDHDWEVTTQLCTKCDMTREAFESLAQEDTET